MNELLLSKVEKQDVVIDKLNNRVDIIEKDNIRNEAKVDNLLQKLNNLDDALTTLVKALNDIKEDVKPIKQTLTHQKNTKKWLFDNVVNMKLPVLIGVLLFSANYLYDLPSPEQIAVIEDLKKKS